MPIITLSCIFLLPANKIRDLGQSRYINSFFLGKGFFILQEDIIKIDKNVNINVLNIMIVNTIKLS
jgi:hypothetical protein